MIDFSAHSIDDYEFVFNLDYMEDQLYAMIMGWA
jgi:hypothetical protein